jgi:hypothetical protein
MIKIGGAGGYGTEFIIDSEIMTDNLILSQEGRQSNADGFSYFLWRTNGTLQLLQQLQAAASRL